MCLRSRSRCSFSTSACRSPSSTAISLLFGALWGTIARERELLRPEVTDEEVNAILLEATPSIGFYVGATALAIVAPRIAAFGYLVIAVLSVLRARGDQPSRAAPA